MSAEDKLRNSLRPGHRLHWYKIERILGQGGFGITYLAHDANLDQRVAIKEYLPMELAVREGDFSVYPASRAQDARYRWGLERFITEARTLARFRHPAIVRVQSVFEANNTAYMVMDYQHGESLQHVLDARGTLPEAELVAMTVPLLEGLETIHAQGFIHRDIKPSNLYIRTDGQPVLLDFGSARQALGTQTQTLTSVVSPGYAPFEQYYSKSDRQGPWTDIYGLGATLYRCVTGLQPMAAIDRSEAILKAERDVFVTASEIGAGNYSRSFLAAIDCALEFNEKKRPQTIAEWRPRFEFSTTVETEIFDAAGTRWPEDAATRFEHGGDTVDLGSAAVVNPDARASASRPSVPPSRPPDPASAPVSAPRSAPPSAAPDTAAAGAPRRRWPLVTAALLVVGVAFGIAAWNGLLGFDPLGGSKAARLVAQGDRALAAGQVFEPAQTSALAYYRRAWDVRPGDENAAHGLRLTGEQLVDALRTALAAGEGERVESLRPLLGKLPAGVVDLAALRGELAAATARANEAAKLGGRIDEFLAAAEADIAAGRLAGAGTDNAIARYRAVQILDPGNAAAAAGLARVAAAFVAQGKQALAAGDFEQTAARLADARGLGVDAPGAAALEQALVAARNAAESEQERAARIEALLEAAAADLAANRLTTPPGSNALERYQQIERLDPGNAAAADGIRQVHDRYVALATQALARGELDDAARFAARARGVLADSDPARTLVSEIAAARERQDRAEAERLAREAEEQAAAEAARVVAAERARAAAESERRRRQEAEAERLLAEAQRKAEAEKQARLSAEQARADAVAARPRMVLDFSGFHPRFARNGMTRDRLYERVAPLVREAGYEVVTRGQYHDANYSWTNVRLMAYRLYVNENTATGLYSYVGTLLVLPAETLKLPLASALEEEAAWERGHNGLGPPTDLAKLFEKFVDATRAFLTSNAGRVR